MPSLDIVIHGFQVLKPWGSGGDPKVILLVTFVDWAKKIVTHERRTDRWTHRRDGRNSDVDF